MSLRAIILALPLVAALHGAEPIHPAELPPLPPPGPSPLQQFRAWLSMPEAEREEALAQYPPDKKRVLREKILSYSVLPQAQLDRRLNMLELRWHLRPLMSVPPAQRAERLAMVPAPIQPMVHARLEAWDKLPAQTRAELLESEEARELVIAHFAQIRRGLTQEQILRSLDPARRSRLEQALEKWNRTASHDRRRMAAQIEQFFEMGPEEQSRTLARLSPAEQADVQRTLDAFAKLPPEQRRACVRSFEKFARMSQEERVSFLRNAARWQAMTPKERETWKDLVTKLPPMPPEPETLPPMPPALSVQRKVATNSAP